MENMEKKNLNNYTLISGVILIALVIFAVFYFINNSNKKTSTPEQPITVSDTDTSNPTTPDNTTEASTASETNPTTATRNRTVRVSTVASPDTKTPVPDPVASPQIVNADRTVSADLSGLTQIDLTGIEDAGSASPGLLDDGFIQIPMAGNSFNFFGTNYGTADTVYWNSNNALAFGSGFSPNTVSISSDTAPAILLGNYDRLTSDIYYSHSTSADINFNITKILVKFADYYLDSANLDAGIYQIRLIKELSGEKRQWIEVSIISSPPSPGYSNNLTVSYPSGSNGSGQPQDSAGDAIDPTKDSPYNITDGITFLNPLGTLYSSASPATGTSFILQSDELGNAWTFTNNSYVNL
jgi:hypothetical protein